MNRADKKPPIPSACADPSATLTIAHQQKRTKTPPWMRESKSGPSTGSLETKESTEHASKWWALSLYLQPTRRCRQWLPWPRKLVSTSMSTLSKLVGCEHTVHGKHCELIRQTSGCRREQNVLGRIAGGYTLILKRCTLDGVSVRRGWEWAARIPEECNGRRCFDACSINVASRSSNDTPNDQPNDD